MQPNYPISFHSTCLTLALMLAMTDVDPCLAEIATMATTLNTTKPGCDRMCGNITIPYPFGIGVGGGCSLSPLYDVFCNLSSNPHKPYLFGWEEEQEEDAGDQRNNVFEILEISETLIRIRNPRVVTMCYNDSSDDQLSSYTVNYMSLTPGSPLSFSSIFNKLVVLGCQKNGEVLAVHQSSNSFGTIGSACISECLSEAEVVPNECEGFGCCQAPVPQRLRNIRVLLIDYSGYVSNDSKVAAFNPCGYTFLAEESVYTFGGLSDLNNSNLPSRVMDTVPVVIHWVIGNETCAQAQLNLSTYACMVNTNCSDQLQEGIGGYKCYCKPGFEGNPYLSPGCSDVNECADPILNTCSHICTNTAGSFECPCPRGHIGDGKKNGTGCSKKTSTIFMLKLGLGISSGCLLLFIGLSWLYILDRKRKLIKMRKKFFHQNGGWLLKQQLSNFGSKEPTKIFTEEELKAATNSFHKDWIVGTGGYGTVYKGILTGNWLVAIKKSKSVDQNQIEQFINEVIILGQVNHRNVVKLFGCCLETEVPLLVYEFIPKGTLYSHIHCSQNEKEKSDWRLTWKDCLRIASEAADAVTYLHSAASPPIIHRDIKSMNILLDDDYIAKIADFGGSRLIPMDQSKLPTLVQGTLGYLDPEYLHSSLLTEKSDVYSFGVVLAELLTRQKPFSTSRPEADRNLATYFVRSIEQETLFDILHPQWVNEASTLELISIASITQRCLRLSGKDRPTMRDVSSELEAIKRLKRQPVLENQIHDEIETTMLLHSYNTVTDAQSTMSLDEERDLYPIPREDETAMLFV